MPVLFTGHGNDRIMNRRFLHIATIFVLTTVLLLAFGCRRHSEAWKLMDTAESLMESVPDSSLSILRTIDSVLLSGKEERARLALLMSMALDKNYIDTTDFSVLQPAIDYYLRKGNADERLRTYYYQGRICQNMGDDDGAMKCFVRGINLRDEVSDTLTLARMLVAQSFIFKNLYNYKEYISNRLSAAELYNKLGRNELRADCLLAALDGYLLNGDKQHSDSIYALCSNEYSEGNVDIRDFLPLQLSYERRFGSRKRLRELLKETSKIEDWTTDRIMTIADCRMMIGENHIAKELLDSLSSSGIPYDSLKYTAIRYAMLDSLGDYKGSLEQLETFIDIFSYKQDKIIDERLQSSEERHEFELESQKNTKDRFIHTVVWSSGICILSLLIILLIFLIRHIQMEKRIVIQEKLIAEAENGNLKGQNKSLMLANKENSKVITSLTDRLETMKAECDRLGMLLKSQNEIPQEVRIIIKDRIGELNDILASGIREFVPGQKSKGKSSEEKIQELVANRKRFMDSTRIAFKASNPSFIRFFEDHGLSTEEINYICLYAIGLNGKEVGAYIQKKGHVNMSSAIRKKLGLDMHETNISIYTRRLLKDF